MKSAYNQNHSNKGKIVNYNHIRGINIHPNPHNENQPTSKPTQVKSAYSQTRIRETSLQSNTHNEHQPTPKTYSSEISLQPNQHKGNHPTTKPT